MASVKAPSVFVKSKLTVSLLVVEVVSCGATLICDGTLPCSDGCGNVVTV